MENKQIQTLLSTLAEQPAEATPDVDNLGLEVARRLKGGTVVDETHPPVCCDLGCALEVGGIG